MRSQTSRIVQTGANSVVAMIHRVIIDVDAGRMVRLQMPPDFHRATLGDNLSMNDYNWSPDASKLALAATVTRHRSATQTSTACSTRAVGRGRRSSFSCVSASTSRASPSRRTVGSAGSGARPAAQAATSAASAARHERPSCGARTAGSAIGSR